MLAAFYDLPLGWMTALTGVVFVGTYWAGCLFVRPVLRAMVGRRDVANTAIGDVLSAFGVLYGLLLSLLAVAGHQNLAEVKSQATAEAASLLALFTDAEQLPEPSGSALRETLRDYCASIVADEWPEQREGRVPSNTRGRVSQLRRELLGVDAGDRRTQLVQEIALRHFDELTEHGRYRRYAARSSIPALMWYVVVVGTVINYVLMWLFDMRLLNQLLLGGVVAFFLGAIILLIAVMDRPYRSAKYGVSPEPYALVLEIMDERMNDPAPAGPDRPR